MSESVLDSSELSQGELSHPSPMQVDPNLTSDHTIIQAADSSEDQHLLSVASIKREQQNNPCCRMFYDYIVHKKLPQNEHDRQKVVIKSDYMSVGENGLLYHHPSLRQRKGRAVKISSQVVLPPNLRNHALQNLHADILAGGHVGRQALSAKITDWFF